MPHFGAALAAQAAAVALELPRHPGQGLLEHEAAALFAVVTVHDVRRVEEVAPAGAAAVGQHLLWCTIGGRRRDERSHISDAPEASVT